MRGNIRSIFKNARNNWKAVLTLTSLVAAFVAAVIVRNQVFFKGKAAPGNANLTISPSAKSVNIGASDFVEVFITPGGEQVAGVELLMTYDASKIQVDSVESGSFFNSEYGNPVVLVNDISTPGKIHYAILFPWGSKHSSAADGVVAKLNFKALATGSTTINFVTTSEIGDPKTSVIDINELEVVGTTTAGTVTVSSGGLLSLSNPTPSNPQALNSNFITQVVMDTGGQQVDAVDAVINYDTSKLQVVNIAPASGSGFNSYPSLANDSTAGKISISANIGTGSTATPVSGSSINIATITLNAKTVTGSTAVNFVFTLGDRNDSNIVLHSTDPVTDPVDILSAVTNLNVVIGTEPTATAVATTTPTPTAVSTPTTTVKPTTTASAVPTPTATAVATATPMPTATPNVGVTVKMRLQGRSRSGISNAAVMVLKYKLVGTTNVTTLNITTNSTGEYTFYIAPGTYNLLIDANNYLARKFANVTVTAGSPYLDLTVSPLLGGDFNNDGIINEVDYTLKYLPNYQKINADVDLDASGMVNSLDYSIMRNNWSLMNDVL